MPTLKVSVALCTCNGEKFLAEQLHSIASQTKLPDELVLCDDASEDRTVEIARQYEKHLPIRIIVNQQRLGSTNNFSQAIAACSEDIIFLCDQDDLWESEKVEKIVDVFLEKSLTGLVFSDAGLIDEDTCNLVGSLWRANRFVPARRQKFENGHAFSHLLRSNIVTGATAAFRSEFKKMILPIPCNWIHDYWIATVIAASAPLSCEVAQLVQYRLHANQQIGIHRNPFQKMQRLLMKNGNLLIEKEKYMALQRRIEAFATNRAVLNELRQKLEHIERRAEVISRPGGGVPKLLKEVVSGNYSRFSYGWIDVFADIAQAVQHVK